MKNTNERSEDESKCRLFKINFPSPVGQPCLVPCEEASGGEHK